MTTRTIPLDELLSMVCCLDDYDLNKPIMREFLKTNIGDISIAEIQDYCNRQYLSSEALAQGYSQEDCEISFKTLKEFFEL